MTTGDDAAAAQVPPSIALAWGLAVRPSRGPRPGLSLEQLVAAGVKVAMTEGIAALSMGRVARELGVGTMSLYRYVSAKDDLLTLMFDAAIGSPPPIDGRAEWREGLTTWARGVRAGYQRHPWVLRIPISGPPLGPNNVAWLDASLQAMARTPLTEQQKLSTTLLISGFVRNEATLTADLRAASGGEQVMPKYGEMLAALLPEGRFPALRQALASGALSDDDDIDVEFDFGLTRILDGVATLIESAGRPTGRKEQHRAR
jgi:AcrR family transcriptional regulator